MARKRSPERDKAYEMWKESGGEMPLVDIAAKLGVSPEQIRKWKHQDKWCAGGPEKKVTRNEKVTLPRKEEKKKQKGSVTNRVDEQILKEIEEAELTEKQKLFCLYYIKNFNATQAAIRAGYSKCSAHVSGPRLLGNDRVRNEIRRLKGVMHEELLIDAMDVLAKYIKIAFSDPSEYVTFGQKEIQVMNMFGPLYEEVGEGEHKVKKPVMKTVNYIDFKESSDVDGSIITEVSQGKDGAKIKFADKMKALEKLELYFDLLPDKWKRRLEEEKLEVQKKRLDIDDKDKTMKVMIVDNIPEGPEINSEGDEQ